MTAATAAVFLLAGCATLPNGKADPRDPFERVNRSIYRFNNDKIVEDWGLEVFSVGTPWA